MEPAKITTFEEWTRGYGEQDENGIDLSLIRENLKLTPWERIQRGDEARRFALDVVEHGVLDTEKIARQGTILPSRCGRHTSLLPLETQRAQESLKHLLAIKRVRDEMSGAAPG